MLGNIEWGLNITGNTIFCLTSWEERYANPGAWEYNINLGSILITVVGSTLVLGGKDPFFGMPIKIYTLSCVLLLFIPLFTVVLSLAFIAAGVLNIWAWGYIISQIKKRVRIRSWFNGDFYVEEENLIFFC